MAKIRFVDSKTEKEALGFLLGRFSGQVFKTGEHILPDEALLALTHEGYQFTVLPVSDNGESGLSRQDISSTRLGPLQPDRVTYSTLNAKQKENYNFQKVSAVLADYGFVTLRLSDDWQGADFIAQHINGETFLKVQLKGRLTFDKKYIGKNLHVAFFYENSWYLYPHDVVLEDVLLNTNIANTKSWIDDGVYSFRSLSQDFLRLLAPYSVTGDLRPLENLD